MSRLCVYSAQLRDWRDHQATQLRTDDYVAGDEIGLLRFATVAKAYKQVLTAELWVSQTFGISLTIFSYGVSAASTGRNAQILSLTAMIAAQSS